jgi:hypothetical protein
MPHLSYFARLRAAPSRRQGTAAPHRLSWSIAAPSLTRNVSRWGRPFYRAAAVLVLNTLLVFGGFELAARGVFRLAGVLSKPTEQLVGEGNPRERVSYYADQAWAARYWQEHRLSDRERYYPYAGWRRAPFHGQTIAVDEHGVRATPGADCRAGAFTVFAFGASEMWGTGSPDWGTIPAHLQRGLAKLRPGPVCVVNFAESAYVSMQDVIMLLTLLRAGRVPDVAVFYNIGSDVYAAYQSGRAGGPQNLAQLAAKFEARPKPPTLVDLLRRTSSYALLDELVGKLAAAAPQQGERAPRKLVTYESLGVDVAELSDAVARQYLGNDALVGGLARQYGFDYVFFLPPRIFRGGKPLTAEEQEMKLRAEADAAHYKLYTAVYEALERAAAPESHLHSLVHVFDRHEALLWIDAVHVTPVGNQLIAASMLDVLQARAADDQ